MSCLKLLFVYLVLHYCHAFSFFDRSSPSTSGQLAQIRHNIEVAPDIFQDGTVSNAVPTSELQRIFRATTLDDPPTRDCFHSKAAGLRDRCRQEIELTEPERVHLAISMTLCELETGSHLSPPMECAENYQWNLIDKGSHRQAAQSACVTALFRTTLWSSYTGYLREASQFCFAFQRQHDIDVARSVYRNATLEKIALLQAIRRREDFDLSKATKMDNVVHDMQETLNDIRRASSHIETIHRDTAVEVFNMLSEQHTKQTSSLRSAHERLIVDIATRQDYMLDEAKIAMKHVQDMNAIIISDLLADAQDRLSETHHLLSERSQAAVAEFHAVDSNWQSLGQGMAQLQQVFEVLLVLSSRASVELRLQVEESIDQRHAIETASQSLDTLVASVHALTTLAEDKLVTLNQTAFEVQQVWLEAQMPGKDSFSGWKEISQALSQLSMLHFTLPGLQAYLDGLYYFMPLLWYLFRAIAVGLSLLRSLAIYTAKVFGIILRRVSAIKRRNKPTLVSQAIAALDSPLRNSGPNPSHRDTVSWNTSRSMAPKPAVRTPFIEASPNRHRLTEVTKPRFGPSSKLDRSMSLPPW